MNRFGSCCLNRLSSRSCAFFGCCFCSVSRCQSTLYAIFGEVSFIALISTNANSSTSRAVTSRCSCAITCLTVAVLPVPGTPLTSARISIACTLRCVNISYICSSRVGRRGDRAQCCRSHLVLFRVLAAHSLLYKATIPCELRDIYWTQRAQYSSNLHHR